MISFKMPNFANNKENDYFEIFANVITLHICPKIATKIGNDFVLPFNPNKFVLTFLPYVVMTISSVADPDPVFGSQLIITFQFRYIKF